VGVDAEAPAPWGGTWGVHAFTERQAFDPAALAPAERTRASLETARWIAPAVRVAASAGADRWRSPGAHGTAGGSLLVRSVGERLEAEVTGDAWWGAARFAAFTVSAGARSSPARTGAVLAARAGVGGVTAAAPLDLWLAGDTGDTRAVLLRAHPLVDDGRIRVDRLGRRLAHASIEARYWRPVSLARVGAAVFADAAYTASGLRPGGRGDVDVGAGVRLAVPGAAGTFRGDVARGLRDGTTTFSFVYEPSGW
jgi:hypothetical protein